MFFISVAFKGLSYTVSLLFATLAGRIISVASNRLTWNSGVEERFDRREKKRRRAAGLQEVPHHYLISIAANRLL